MYLANTMLHDTGAWMPAVGPPPFTGTEGQLLRGPVVRQAHECHSVVAFAKHSGASPDELGTLSTEPSAS